MSVAPASHESADVAVLAALELALDRAYHDGSRYELAVVSEAYRQAGYYDESVGVSHARSTDVLAAVDRARRGRHKAKLHARGGGLLYGLRLLAAEGIVTWENASEARRQRWIARGGHDGPV